MKRAALLILATAVLLAPSGALCDEGTFTEDMLMERGYYLSSGHSFLNRLTVAKGNIRRGKIRFHPGLEFRVTWDDNLFNSSTNRKNGFVFATTPALVVKAGTRHKLEVGYALDYTHFGGFGNFDFMAHTAKASVEFNSPKGIRFTLRDVLVSTENARPEELHLRARNTSNVFQATLGYEFPARKLMLEARYSMNYLRFEQDANSSFNKVAYTFGGSAYLRVRPKTFLVLGYSYTTKNHFDSAVESEDKDANGHSLNAGLKWTATEKTIGTLKLGWQNKRYKNNTDSLGNNYIDRSAFSVEGLITYFATEKMSFNFALNRSIEDTEYIGTTEKSKSTNYINTGGSIRLQHRLNPKLALNLHVGYYEHNYNRINLVLQRRADHIIEAGIGLNYNIRRWLSTNLHYTHHNNSSTDYLRDVVNNRYYFSVTAAL